MAILCDNMIWTRVNFTGIYQYAIKHESFNTIIFVIGSCYRRMKFQVMVPICSGYFCVYDNMLLEINHYGINRASFKNQPFISQSVFINFHPLSVYKLCTQLHTILAARRLKEKTFGEPEEKEI